MLQFDQITKIFKTDIMAQPFQALSNVSFEIPRGSMVGFLGANGAGKTTSLKIIMDFIRADEGSVIFDKSLGKTKYEIFKKIGFLPERPYFYPNLTGLEFLTFMGSLSEMTSKEIKDSISKWTVRFKIEHAINRPLRTYSKGMLQRIGFLSTILHDPELIILDEPLSGLDPVGRKELKDVIIEVHREGKTVFFSTHIVPDVEELCDRVIFLKEGKLVYDGAVDLLIRPEKDAEYLIKCSKLTQAAVGTQISSFENIPGDISIIKVHQEHKHELLTELNNKNVDILGLDLIKPSLEEIFYKIKAE